MIESEFDILKKNALLDEAAYTEMCSVLNLTEQDQKFAHALLVTYGLIHRKSLGHQNTYSYQVSKGFVVGNEDAVAQAKHFKEITRKNLLEFIENRMKDLGVNMAQLEKAAGVPKDTIRDLYRNKTYMLRVDKYQKIMAILAPELKVF